MNIAHEKEATLDTGSDIYLADRSPTSGLFKNEPKQLEAAREEFGRHKASHSESGTVPESLWRQKGTTFPS